MNLFWSPDWQMYCNNCAHNDFSIGSVSIPQVCRAMLCLQSPVCYVWYEGFGQMEWNELDRIKYSNIRNDKQIFALILKIWEDAFDINLMIGDGMCIDRFLFFWRNAHSINFSVKFFLIEWPR